MTIKEKIEWKQELYRYRKRNRQAKKDFRKMLKEYHPFDYGIFLNIMQIYFTHLRDYYAAGDNVNSSEAIDLGNNNYPTRLEIATKVVELINEYDRCNYDKDEIVLKELFDYLGKYLVFLWD